jgi:hypothetical protein
MLLMAALAPAALFAQDPAAAPAPPKPPEEPKLSFTTPAGLLLIQIKPDQTAVFEELLTKLRAARPPHLAPPPPQQGVSENIMLGQLCPLGTGAFDLLLNEEGLAPVVDLLPDEDDYEYGDGFMTPGRMTPGHMTPSRTPHYTPNRSVVCLCVCWPVCVEQFVRGGRC